jgi:hypothetical protein
MFRGLCFLLAFSGGLLCIQALPVEPVSDSTPHGSLPLDPARTVAVTVVSPADGAVVPTHTAAVEVRVDNFPLAPGGNSLHLLLDNGPPLEITDPSKPLHFAELTEGAHCLRLIAVRPDGRALTNAESFVRTYFYVRRRNFQNFIPVDAPLLTVNLPGNTPVDLSSGSRLWLDYLLLNAPLAKTGAYRIRYKINGQENFVYDDRRIYWENLKPGRYDCEVELQQSDGTPLLGSFYQVKRTFLLRTTAKALPVGQSEPATPEHNPTLGTKPTLKAKSPKPDLVGAPPP